MTDDELVALAVELGDAIASCECRDGCQCEHRAGPAAYEVARNGKTMRVCTRCDFASDRPTRRLLVTRDIELRPYREDRRR